MREERVTLHSTTPDRVLSLGGISTSAEWAWILTLLGERADVLTIMVASKRSAPVTEAPGTIEYASLWKPPSFVFSMTAS